MTRRELLKYGSDGTYWIVSFLVEDTGTVIDYIYTEEDEERAREHADMLRNKNGEQYVSLMKCEYKSL